VLAARIILDNAGPAPHIPRTEYRARPIATDYSECNVYRVEEFR
jgi:hypothetical protein